MKEPKTKYELRIKHLEALLDKQDKNINKMSNIRLLEFLIGLICTVFLILNKSYFFGLLAIILTISGFLYLVSRHTKFNSSRECTKMLIKLNQDSIKRLDGSWTTFEDTGAEFVNDQHNYSDDLDIFGKGSVFQWSNLCSTFTGRVKLKEALEGDNRSIDSIKSHQEAVTELSKKFEWRQRFIALGKAVKGKEEDTQKLYEWLNKKNNMFLRKEVIAIVKILPVITCLSIILAVMSRIPFYIPVVALFIQYIFLKINQGQRREALEEVYRRGEYIKVYYNMLKKFECHKFHSKYINELQKSLINKKRQTAFKEIEELSKISESISNMHNDAFFIINILTLWDYQCMISLERFKERSGKYFKQWINVLGELEMLSSLAEIKNNNPDWCLPVITEDFKIEAENAGHPLISLNRVCNSFYMDGSSSIAIITGSNMSGKSTFLRTIGLNLVLAYAGAPVCSQKFSCSIMNICTCMRIRDNLENNISSFYAEILKIKHIISEAQKDEKVFFILDEIFRGTNSQDRHTGAKLLIKDLAKKGAAGLVSTHDLELCEIENEMNGKYQSIVRNYHFREYYKNDKIQFDYLIRRGESTTRNAMYLIKMAGISVEEK